MDKSEEQKGGSIVSTKLAVLRQTSEYQKEELESTDSKRREKILETMEETHLKDARSIIELLASEKPNERQVACKILVDIGIFFARSMKANPVILLNAAEVAEKDDHMAVAADLYYHLAQAYERQGDLETAKNILLRASELYAYVSDLGRETKCWAKLLTFDTDLKCKQTATDNLRKLLG